MCVCACEETLVQRTTTKVEEDENEENRKKNEKGKQTEKGSPTWIDVRMAAIS